MKCLYSIVCTQSQLNSLLLITPSPARGHKFESFIALLHVLMASRSNRSKSDRFLTKKNCGDGWALDTLSVVGMCHPKQPLF